MTGQTITLYRMVFAVEANYHGAVYRELQGRGEITKPREADGGGYYCSVNGKRSGRRHATAEEAAKEIAFTLRGDDDLTANKGGTMTTHTHPRILPEGNPDSRPARLTDNEARTHERIRYCIDSTATNARAADADGNPVPDADRPAQAAIGAHCADMRFARQAGEESVIYGESTSDAIRDAYARGRREALRAREGSNG